MVRILRLSIYIIDIGVFFLVQLILLLGFLLFIPFVVESPEEWMSKNETILIWIAIIRFAISIWITILFHDKLKEYLEEHSEISASVAILQLLVISFGIFLYILNEIAKFFFPFVVMFLIYYYIFK